MISGVLNCRDIARQMDLLWHGFCNANVAYQKIRQFNFLGNAMNVDGENSCDDFGSHNSKTVRAGFLVDGVLLAALDGDYFGDLIELL